MSKKILMSTAVAAVLFLTASCATAPANPSEFDQYDRFETFNRAVFKFNYEVDKYVIKPVTRGYRAITTPFVRERVNNALANLLEPMSSINQVLQGEFKQSAVSLGRFAVNSTLGLAGTFDVAGAWGWKKEVSGFDSTLAKWCVPDGPYLVLPLLGPSTPRSAASLIVDAYTEPVYWAAQNDANYKDKIMWGSAAVVYIAVREKTLDLMEDLERNSVDYYATMRTAYLQNRAKKNVCINSDAQDVNYDFDFGIEDEDEVFDAEETAAPVLPQHKQSDITIDKAEIK